MFAQLEGVGRVIAPHVYQQRKWPIWAFCITLELAVAEVGRMSYGLTGAAEAHLRLLAEDGYVPESMERYYFTLATEYGVPAGRIAELSGRPLERVRRLIGGM